MSVTRLNVINSYDSILQINNISNENIRIGLGGGITDIGTTTPLNISSTGSVTINNTTASTSTTTGSLIISGGVGIAGALFASSGTFSTFTAPHSGLTGLLNDDHTQYSLLAGRSGGQILTGGTAASNNLTIRSTSNATKGSILIDETTASTSTTTGALVVSGGVGISTTTDAVSSTNGGTITTAGGAAIAKKLFVGTDLSVSGISTLGATNSMTVSAAGLVVVNNTTNATSSTSAALRSVGGISSNLDMWAGGIINTDSYFFARNVVSYAPPSFTSRSVGTKLLVYPDFLASTRADYALGIEGAAMWYGVPDTSKLHKFYHGITNTMSLSGTNLNLPTFSTASTSSTIGAFTLIGGIGISNTTDAVSSTNGGTITTAGGAAIAKKLFVGTDLSVSGITTLGTTTAATFSAVGVLTINNTTASTSTSSGSIIITGGIGISNTTDAVSSTNGGTITTAGGVAIAKKLFVGTDLSVSGISTLGATTSATVSATGVLSINNVTDSSSITTGSLINYGGLSVAKKLYTGTDVFLATVSGITTIGSSSALTISATGVLSINNVSDSSSITTGSLINYGGLSVAKKLYTGTDVFLATVSGITTIGSTTSLIITADGVLNVNNASSSINPNTASAVFQGGVSINNSTEASSTTQGGAMTISGGLAVGKKVFVAGNVSFSNGLNMNNTLITNLPAPISNNDATNKAYVDSVAQGLDIKQSVLVATTGPGTLSSSFENGDIIDGVTLTTGDRILIKDQVSSIENGIYIVQTTGSPLRSSDFALFSSQSGAFTFVQNGTVNADSGWVVTNDPPTDIVGTHNILFTQFSGAGQIIAGTGIIKSANTLSVNSSLGHVTIVGTLTSLTVSPGTISGVSLNLSGLTANSPIFTDASKNFVSTTSTGSGTTVVLQNTPTLITPIIGVATGTSLNLTGTTPSTSTTTGTLIISGGVGIAGALYTGAATNIASISGITTIGSSTPMTVSAAGLVAIQNSTSVANSNVMSSTSGSLNINGDLSLYNATKNTIIFSQSGTAAPTFTTRSVGSKLVLYPNLSGTSTDYALGIEGNTLWYSIDQAASNRQHRWYGGTTQLMNLTGDGKLSIPSTTASTSNTTGILLLAGGIGISNTTDAVSSTNGGTITTAGGVAIAKKLFVGTDLSVSGISTLGATNSMTISAAGAVNIASTLGVTGLGTFSGGLTSTAGTTTLGATTIGAITGTSATFSSTLRVTGATAIGAITDPNNISELFIRGNDQNISSGPHIAINTAADNFPVFHQLNWKHDNICLGFDTYYDGGTFRTSHTTNGFGIYKIGNELKFQYSNSTGAGTATTMIDALKISSTGGLFVTGNRNPLTPNVKGIYLGEGGTDDYAIEICAAGASNFSYIDFTYPNTDYRGRISYSHASNLFSFYTSGSGTPSINIGANGTASTSTTTGTLIVSGGVGIAGTMFLGGLLDILSAKSGTPSTSGQYLRISSSTFTDTNTAASGTAASMVFNSIAVPTLAATNTSVTTTNAATLYIAGGPTAGTNQTLTNSYGIWNAGNQRIDGISTLGATNSMTVSAAGLVVVNNTTNATSSTSAALRSVGGISSNLDIWAGGKIITDSYVSLTNVATFGPPLLDSISAGTRLLIYPDTGANTTDYAIGIESSTMWYSVPTNTTHNHRWYGGTTQIMNLSGTGQLSLPRTIASTSTTTGTLVVSGGVGIAGALFASSGNFTTLTAPHSGLTGLSNDDHTQYSLLAGRSGGQILTGGTAASNNLTIRSTSNATKGSILIDETTTSTSTTTGALIVSGGVGISNTTDAVSSTNGGTITTAGGVAIAKKLFVGTDLSVSGISTLGATTIGAITGTSATFSSTLGVSGISTLGATNSMTVSAAGVVNIASTLGVTGLGTFSGGLTSTSGTTTLGATTIGAITGTSATFSTTLGVSGISTLGATNSMTVSAAGVVNIASTLGVTGLGTFSGGLTSTSGTTTLGATTIGAITGTSATFSTTLGVSGISTLGATNSMTVSAAGLVAIQNNTSVANSNSMSSTSGSLNINGDLSLYNATKNTIVFSQSGSGAPTFTTRSVGSKLVLYPSLSGTSTDHALGIDVNTVWYSIDQATSNKQHRWYGGTTQLMNLTGDGKLSIPSTTASTSNTTGILLLAGGVGISNTTDAVSSTNGGTITTAGGVAIAKKLFVGNDVNLATVSGITSIGSSTQMTVSAAGILRVQNTTNATSSSSAALVVDGGLGVSQSVFIGTKNITPNIGDITSQTTFVGAQSASAANVTGLSFNTANTRSFEVLMSVVIVATTSLYAQFKLQGIYNGTSWYFAPTYLGDNTLVTFAITNGGQVTYSSSTYTGFSSLTMKFKATTLNI